MLDWKKSGTRLLHRGTEVWEVVVKFLPTHVQSLKNILKNTSDQAELKDVISAALVHGYSDLNIYCQNFIVQATRTQSKYDEKYVFTQNKKEILFDGWQYQFLICPRHGLSKEVLRHKIETTYKDEGGQGDVIVSIEIPKETSEEKKKLDELQKSVGKKRQRKAETHTPAKSTESKSEESKRSRKRRKRKGKRKSIGGDIYIVVSSPAPKDMNRDSSSTKKRKR